ncbi:phospholipase A1 [Monomorium pharaonis]|uniref:phospholipase A1 n=1 Tax=Monomorium pharaonis TaxID=307658 RepID=UPI00063F0DCF|nr:phospholipase A1 [Monomorium pharaonis]XP_012528566.1 phospholipase A1 [Monomorium pharaonis]
MMLITIASFIVQLCGFFTIAATNNNLDAMTNDAVTSMNIGDLSNSCIFGVHSVSVLLYNTHTNISIDKFIKVNESCDLFDLSKPIFIMTHGFIANSSNYNFSDLASQLLKRDYTVFSVDWSNASCYNDPAIINLLEYPSAVDNVRDVGNYLASFIKSITDMCGVPLRNVTLMGHSLGAHISSFAAKYFTHSNNYDSIPLLIGTDPASPLFELRGCKDKFCKSDAKRVIALHTSLLGLQISLGHLDLWFNGGVSQPACGGDIIGSLNVNCSHNIVIVYLITSLDNCTYTGVSVSSKVIPVPNVMPGCSSSTTNYVSVDDRIIDKHYSLTGDYCIFVKSKYPYCTENNFSDEKLLPF